MRCPVPSVLYIRSENNGLTRWSHDCKFSHQLIASCNELTEGVVDLLPCTGNTGNYTGSFLESIETYLADESLTVNHQTIFLAYPKPYG
ncbi:hypothetical protein Q3G72_028265 [Acer saccharum]|nr:hypothetical protein Q3G72_028265 [Acer saccharum]